MLTFGSLFAGIGGFDLGFERAGMQCMWQVEIDPFCQQVLAKHWPNVERFSDVREVGAHNLGAVDVICGGFPCQDISNAGRRAGITGERSGLWSEFARIIRELRPRYAVMENVSALLVRGMGTVLGDLAACGYDAEWQVLRASDIGATHRRARIFILAYSKSANGERGNIGPYPRNGIGWGSGSEFNESSIDARTIPPWMLAGGNWQASESPVLRVDDGVSNRLDRNRRLKACGNAIVPQVAEWLGRRIVEGEQRDHQ